MTNRRIKRDRKTGRFTRGTRAGPGRPKKPPPPKHPIDALSDELQRGFNWKPPSP